MRFEDISGVNPEYGYEEDLTCRKCGETLVPKKPPEVAFYRKGKPIYYVTLKCPRMKWWNGHKVGLYTSEGGWWHLLSPGL